MSLSEQVDRNDFSRRAFLVGAGSVVAFNGLLRRRPLRFLIDNHGNYLTDGIGNLVTC